MKALLFIALAFTLLLPGCANPSNKRTAERYYELGQNTSIEGRHFLSAELYRRADINAQLGGYPPEGRARTLYAYGRQLALTGKLEHAEKVLLDSLELQRQADPQVPTEIVRRTCVLGRLYFDTNRPGEALRMFREADTVLASLPNSTLGPEDKLSILLDLRASADAAGATAEFAEVNERVATIRKTYGENIAPSEWNRFTPAAIEARLAADKSPTEFSGTVIR